MVFEDLSDDLDPHPVVTGCLVMQQLFHCKLQLVNRKQIRFVAPRCINLRSIREVVRTWIPSRL